MELTQEYIRSRFDYDPEGFLVWKDHPRLYNHKRKIGQRTGTVNGRGYVVCQLDGKTHFVHRLIFLWHHGYLPEVVDHDDRNKLNNREDNLFDKSQGQNRQNSNYHVRNPDKASGHKNIQKVPRKGGEFSYLVCVTKEGKRYTKTLRDLDEAIEYRDTLIKELYGEGARA